MSGNGEYIANRSTLVTELSLPEIGTVKIPIPPGTGGGCVTTGPFANITVPFGEVSTNTTTSSFKNPQNLAHTPHCLRRDLNPSVVNVSLTAAQVEAQLALPNITIFTYDIEIGADPNIQNLHAGGHFGVGRDMRDTFSSPGDPIFYLHHAQIDRIWTKWQNKNLSERQYAFSGTGTMFNYPETPDFQLNDTMTLGKLSPEGPQPIRDFMNTLGGPFCYVYAA
ncbi:hypothetical protein MMC07_005718 [Pseudocyphellaria aurata]|nr:hypothetical protein [Pseudocyphellaria aurata]